MTNLRRAAFLISSCFLILSAARAGSIPVLKLSLDHVVESTLKNAPQVQASQYEYESALARSKSQMAPLFPKLSFDASYRYQSEVPSFSPLPAGPKTQFGDHKNYSYGPAISWLAWDSGGNYHRWKSSQALAQVKYFEHDALTRQEELQARLAYFQVQLALEQTRAVSEALLLGQQQYNDISLQQKAGTLSRIDQLSSHDEVLSRYRELREARVNLAQGLRELFALTGLGADLDPSVPFINMIDPKKFPANIEEPTLLVELDPLDKTLALLGPAENSLLDEKHPQLEVLEQSAEAARRTAQGLSAQHGPVIQVSAKTSRDYPNGPVLESIHQNTVGIVASLPLFEFKRVVNDVKAQQLQVQALGKRKEQTALNLKRDWNKTQDQLKGLYSEQSLNQISVDEVHSLVKLVYDSYKAGRSTYLEVERANYRALVADVRSIQNNVQILIQLAVLDSLAQR